jgi:hypothetical protein
MEGVIGKLLEAFEHGKINRRQLIHSLMVTAVGTAVAEETPAADDSGLVTAAGINHISIQAMDVDRECNFYINVLGLKVLSHAEDNLRGKTCMLQVGDTKILIRNPSVRRQASPGLKVNHGSDVPGVDHISYTMANWDADPEVEKAVRANLLRMGLPTGQDQQPGKSRTFHVNDLIGLGVQLGGKSQV